MLAPILIWINIVGFVGYGIFCFFLPEKAAAAMGFVLSNADAEIEISAMYGGVQLMIGLFCMLALRIEKIGIRSALTIMLMIYLGLVLGRVYGFLTVAGEVTFYTQGATSFEVFMLLLLSYSLFEEVKSKN
ncbi:MAG: DUF4345 family protein [Pseudomonadales bacterium]|nr:DUF4345 family protein [Pseudomonadales bacterium]